MVGVERGHTLSGVRVAAASGPGFDKDGRRRVKFRGGLAVS